MMDPFQRSLAFVLKWEGGFSNHPNDPGGATMRGITQAVYDGYRARKGQAKQTVKNLSQAELEDIYRGQYWTPAKCSTYPWPECLIAFDAAVNCGVSRSLRWMEKKNAHDALVERAHHYLSLVFAKPRQFRVFLKGWMNRLTDLALLSTE